MSETLKQIPTKNNKEQDHGTRGNGGEREPRSLPYNEKYVAGKTAVHEQLRESLNINGEISNEEAIGAVNKEADENNEYYDLYEAPLGEESLEYAAGLAEAEESEEDEELSGYPGETDPTKEFGSLQKAREDVQKAYEGDERDDEVEDQNPLTEGYSIKFDSNKSERVKK